ncbi:MAG: 8-oxo-dGDP phosphatase [Solirubrobacteraceae bacterium]|jgi:ADP-ribose pyrophosphatase|nr:8-oxo-dGDP phosphatase [Solirubrobacteraceae bacterium]
MTEPFERVGADVVWKGKIAEVRLERFRHSDGEIVEREVIGHPGAVAVVAHDEERVWLVRQPREAAGEPDLLELPAGKLDVPEEGPLETAKRELAEEIGKAARDWRELTSFYTSPGFTDERVIVYLATGLSDASAEADESERIEVVPWPLDRLDDAIESCHDSKSLVGLLWLALERAAQDARPR